MHRWVPSQTTATPSGLIFSLMISAIWIGHPFLQLQSASENVDHTRDLAEADHLPIRDVGNVALAEERQQVVLTHAVEVDITNDYHLAIVDAEQRTVQHSIDIRLVAAGEKPERLVDSVRRLDQPLAGGVFAQLDQQALDQILHRFIIYPGRRHHRRRHRLA